MILAAGLGSRLKPLTDHTPKALLKAGPYTLLEFAVRKLKAAGIRDIIVNVHHHADQIEDYLSLRTFGCNISVSDESSQLLDTGGGIKKASWFLRGSEPFIVYNADIVCGADPGDILSSHLKNGNLATLAVRRRETSRYLLFDEELHLCGWENRSTGEQIISIPGRATTPLAFSGIHVINPEIFTMLPSAERFYHPCLPCPRRGASYRRLSRHAPSVGRCRQTGKPGRSRTHRLRNSLQRLTLP